MAKSTTIPEKVYTYMDMLNMYLDRELYWAHNNNHLLQTMTDSDLNTVIGICEKENQDKIYNKARAKDWLIVLRLEEDSRKKPNGDDE